MTKLQNTSDLQNAHKLRIQFDRLRDDVLNLSAFGSDPDGGITRHAFSEPYEKARSWLKSRMTEADMDAHDDLAGNTICRLSPLEGPCVLSGSHIDTVPNGGPLDGTYGVLAALEVARTLKDSGLQLPMGFEVCAFVEEEGRYLDCMGAKAITGDLNKEDVMTAVDPNGETLSTVMLNAGFQPENAHRAQRDDIATYVELHIEQGPILEHNKCSVGIVVGIAGIQQHRITFDGQPDHAGTTPLELRHDAFAATAEYAFRAREMVKEMDASGSARFTIGDIQLRPGAANVVPSHVIAIQEIRDISAAKIEDITQRCKELADEITVRYDVPIQFEDMAYTAPVAMDDAISTVIAGAALRLNHPTHDMPSGAGHDAQVIAKIAPSGMIFVPSNGGRSHCPEEWTEWRDLEIGANVLLQTVVDLLWQQTTDEES